MGMWQTCKTMEAWTACDLDMGKIVLFLTREKDGIITRE